MIRLYSPWALWSEKSMRTPYHIAEISKAYQGIATERCQNLVWLHYHPQYTRKSFKYQDFNPLKGD